jgi:shikimate kinase/3-dehydroquinate synthase
MAALFLIGFMAAGKTSVGRALAHRTARRFVDLDEMIAAKGESVAALVARDEPEFRRREAAALAEASDTSGDWVVATGGGAATYGDNLPRMRAAGLVVALGVDLAEAHARAAGGPSRPLLARARELAAMRAPTYRRAHAVVDTTGKAIDEVVAEVAAVEAVWRRLPAGHGDATIVGLGERSYPIIVHEAAIDGELVRAAFGTPSKIAVITDRNVSRHWRRAAEDALGSIDSRLGSSGASPIDVIEVDAGEASKSFAVYETLCAELVARGLDRGSAIIALGGGVVGDLAGFVAATLYRGIPIVQLPTTIVAMTDAAIGGKTAVDLPAGKNLVGAFHQPRLVACGLATLATLPPRERRAGFGELWKYALLDGRGLWDAVDACAAWARGGGAVPQALRTVIDRSIAYKAAIVGRDERERTGHRALLNLGHTIGHAIETESVRSSTPFHHGEAVALGLVAACRVSAALGHQNLEPAVVEALRRTGLPVDLTPWLTDAVLDRVMVDKKRIGAKIRFVVAVDVGVCEVTEIDVTELRRILRPVRTA